MINANINTVVRRYPSGSRALSGLIKTLDFTSSVPSDVDVSGSAAGYARKNDGTYQAFGSGPRITDRGMMVEEGRENYALQSMNPGVWATGFGTFDAVNNKISIFPGETAKEYVATIGSTARLTVALSIPLFTFGGMNFTVFVETTGLTDPVHLRLRDIPAGADALTVRWNGLESGTVTFNANDGTFTGKLYGHQYIGVGPNGGKLYSITMFGVPVTPSNNHELWIYPNNNIAPVANTSVIIHGIQTQGGTWTTSPIKTTNAKVLRSADVITAAIDNGFYDIRYNLSDGTVRDVLNNEITSGMYTLSNQYVETIAAGTNVLVSYKGAQVQELSFWTPRSFILCADSFGGLLLNYLGNANDKFYRPLNWTFQFTGGNSIAQIRTAFEATPQHFDKVLIICDGGLDSGISGASYVSTVAAMVANLTHDNWWWVQPGLQPNAGGTAIDSAYLAYYNETMAAMEVAYPDRIIYTRDILYTFSDGSANDIADVAAGLCPRSLRVAAGDIHPNTPGSIIWDQIISDAIKYIPIT